MKIDARERNEQNAHKRDEKGGDQLENVVSATNFFKVKDGPQIGDNGWACGNDGKADGLTQINVGHKPAALCNGP